MIKLIVYFVLLIAASRAGLVKDVGVSSKLTFDDDSDTETVVRTFQSSNDEKSASLLLKRLASDETTEKYKFEIDGVIKVTNTDPKKDDFISQETPIIKDIPIVTTLDSHHHNSIPQRSYSGTNSFQPSLNYPRNQGASSFTGNFQSNYNKNNGVIWSPNTAKLNQDYLTAVNNFNLKQQWLYQQQHTTTEKPGNVQKFHIVSTVLLPPLISTDAAFNQFIINNEKPQSVVPLYRGNTPQIGSVARRCDKCRLQPAVSPFKNTGRVDNPKKIRVDDKLEDLD